MDGQNTLLREGMVPVARVFDEREGLYVCKLLPGQYYATTEDEMLVTILGSCVSACIRDPERGVGGLNHFMLPGMAAPGQGNAAGTSMDTKYGVEAMTRLIDKIVRLGGRKSELEVKLVGGAAVLDMKGSDIGTRNAAFARAYFAKLGLELSAEDLGGDRARKIKYFPSSGRLMVRRVRSLHNQTVARDEANCASAIRAGQGR